MGNTCAKEIEENDGGSDQFNMRAVEITSKKNVSPSRDKIKSRNDQDRDILEPSPVQNMHFDSAD